jgi:hypothetical protein
VSQVSKPSATTRRQPRTASSRTCRLNRTCIRSLLRAARIRASNVAVRATGSTAGTQSTTFTVAASAAAGTARKSRIVIRARRIGEPLTQRRRPELRYAIAT